MRTLIALSMIVAIGACSPTEPTPSVPPNSNNTCNVTGSNNTCNIGSGGNVGTPPSPSAGPFVRPDYVKVTQYGETCPDGTAPAGNRMVRVGCRKAITCSPKCKQAAPLPDIDCPIPQGAAPDSFEVISGGSFVSFAQTGENPFNAGGFGVSPGLALISCTYAGVVAQEPFDLTVVP